MRRISIGDKRPTARVIKSSVLARVAKGVLYGAIATEGADRNHYVYLTSQNPGKADAIIRWMTQAWT